MAGLKNVMFPSSLLSLEQGVTKNEEVGDKSKKIARPGHEGLEPD